MNAPFAIRTKEKNVLNVILLPRWNFKFGQIVGFDVVEE